MRSSRTPLPFLLVIPALAIILSSISCNREKCCEVNSNQSVVGDWNWVGSTNGASVTVTPASSGISKKLSFRDNGTVYITHNDSTGFSGDLLVQAPSIFQAITKTVTETDTYRTDDLPAACVNIKFPVIILNGQGCYQYSVSNDTLQVSTSTCLAPYLSTYIRSN
jgi:hypothetical protein